MSTLAPSHPDVTAADLCAAIQLRHGHAVYRSVNAGQTADLVWSGSSLVRTGLCDMADLRLSAQHGNRDLGVSVHFLVRRRGPRLVITGTGVTANVRCSLQHATSWDVNVALLRILDHTRETGFLAHALKATLEKQVPCGR